MTVDGDNKYIINLGVGCCRVVYIVLTVLGGVVLLGSLNSLTLL